MRSDDRFPHDEVKQYRPRFRWELYYYERVGTEYHLRITPFALILIVVALAIGFTILFLDGRRSQGRPDVNITTLPAPTASPLKSAVTPVQSPSKPLPNK
jgi:hypothetical protein